MPESWLVLASALTIPLFLIVSEFGCFLDDVDGHGADEVADVVMRRGCAAIRGKDVINPFYWCSWSEIEST